MMVPKIVLVQVYLRPSCCLIAVDTLASEMHVNVRFQLVSETVTRAPIAIQDRSSRNQYAIIHGIINIIRLNDYSL